MNPAQVPKLSFGSIPNVVPICGELRARKMKIPQGYDLSIYSVVQITRLNSINTGNLFDG